MRKKQQGFTIIEVVLVLAIAGLIFLMVFIALPALQRNQRDTQRKNDVGRTITAINNFQSNSKGDLPQDQTEATTVQTRLKANGDSYADPAFGDYTLKFNASATAKPAPQQIQYSKKFVCGNDGLLSATIPGVTPAQAVGDRQFAVRVLLESGQIYCASNN